jgi:cytoskeletal protein CcmA (bactofilin family)
MRAESGKIEGDLEVKDAFVITGMVTGNIVVISGGILDLHGMCVKNVIVRSGGTARLHGMVSGDAINEGGSLEVHGTVNGAVRTVNGTTVVSPSAVVVRGVSQATGDNSQAVGFIGGAALGAAIGGPVGAIVGGVIGAILGKDSKGLG